MTFGFLAVLEAVTSSVVNGVTLTSVAPTTTAAVATGSNQIVEISQAFGIKPWILLAQVINFSIVAAILYFFVIKPIQSKLDERAKLIDEGLKRSEETQALLKAAHDEKEIILQQARKEAKTMTENAQKEISAFQEAKRAEVQKQTADMLAAAEVRQQEEYRSQMKKAQNELADVVVKLAEKSLEENLTGDQKLRFNQRVGTRMNELTAGMKT
jgi:F-type H+-transporting ATPase subunit b